jgi:hypothetical protein
MHSVQYLFLASTVNINLHNRADMPTVLYHASTQGHLKRYKRLFIAFTTTAVQKYMEPRANPLSHISHQTFGGFVARDAMCAIAPRKHQVT